MLKLLFNLFVRPKIVNLHDYRRSRRMYKMLSIYYLVIYFFSKLKIKKIEINKIECIKFFVKKNELSNNIIIYAHGGGFSAGSSYSHLNIIYNLCYYTKLTLYSVNYSLSPENKFPKALFEVIDVYKFLKKKFPKSNIAIGGDSCGANLALAAILKLKEMNIKLPKLSFLICSGIDLNYNCSSIKSNYHKDYFQSPKEYCPEKYGFDVRKNYLNNDDNVNNPLISPLKGNVNNLPPIFLQISDTELLYQDTIDLHQKIISNNGLAEIEIWKDLPHAWHMFNFFSQSKQALVSISKFILKYIYK